jgi:hypothetical protein
LFNEDYDVLIRLIKSLEEPKTSMSGLWRLKKKNQVDHIIELDAKQEVELANT